MPLFFIVLALVAIPLIDTSFEVGRSSNIETQVSQASALGANMLVVRNALQAFVRENPSVNREIALAELGLPTWFHPQSDLHTLVESGRAYVYYTPAQPKPDLASALGIDPPGLTGIAHNARLISPRLQTITPLPPIIPDHSFVLVL